MTPGTVIAGRYRCERLLGRGGMGSVHAAIDLRTDRRVALKLMHGHRLDSDDARARFEREARVGARIASPYLVDVLDAGADTDTGTPFLVMELLEGEDLEQRLTRLGPRPAAEVIAHLGQLALALAHMRAGRVVHRDLKPSNLFLQERKDEAARLKVLDLGVAKELSETGGHTTGIAGTPVYMAPEQIGGGPVSPSTDLYAFGLIAFTLLAGAPYWAKAPGDDAIALAVRMKDGPRRPASERAAELGATLPAGFDAWFARATARRPERRFPSATAAVRELAAVLGVEAPALPDEPAPDGPPPAAEDQATDDGLGGLRDGAAATATATAPPGGTASTVLARPPAAPAALAPTSAAPPARTTRRTAAVAAATIAVVGGAGLAGRALWWPTAAARSPLAAPRAVLACPVLAVDDAAEDGWLGAAAASLACERARVLLGGEPARTLIPAELLELPGEPRDDFPADPFTAADARDRTLVAARRRGAAYLDGRVERSGRELHVALILRRADGGELARGDGRGPGLHGAVRAAMAPLVDGGALPTAAIVDPAIADQSQAWDAPAMLDLLDLAFAFIANAGELGETCAAFAARHPEAAPRMQFARYECAFTLGQPVPAIELPATPARTAGEDTTRARVAHMALRRDDPAAIARLEERYRREPSSWGRSAIAATLSCLVQRDGATAAEWAQRAVQHEPRNPTGEWCAPWDQFATLSARAAVTRGLQAWQPWHAYGWLLGADPSSGEAALRYARRAYALAPQNTTVAGGYAALLVRHQHPEEARSVAMALAASPHRVHALAKELILVDVEASEARFDAAERRARAAMEARPDDAGWVRTQRLEAASRALAIAAIIGTERARAVADLAIATLVMPEPAPIDGAYVDVPIWLATLCAHASPDLAAPCFARVDALVRQLAGAALVTSAAYVEGARRHAAGDIRGAAQAWRPLLRDQQYGGLAAAMVTAFAADGDPAAVARLVETTAGDGYHGASLVTARAALAAAARGDRDTAHRLAAQVLAAWSIADVEPAILDELRAL